MAKPKIRFKGYQDDWEQRKLGDDIVNIHTGTNLIGSESNSGLPLIKMGNIQRGYFDTSKLEYLAENEYPEKEDIANYGDFFFNTRNTLELVGKGATWMGTSGEYAFNSNIARFEFKNIDTIFLNYLYNTEDMTRQIHARAMGTTSVAAIYPRNLESVEYYVPIMEEQQMIGSYFQSIDRLITLHQRKCDEAKKLKKFMLQKMFPQNGSLVPEIRFDGFTDDWEQRKLGEILISLQNNTLSRADLSNETGVAKNVHYGDVLIKFGEILDVSKEQLQMILDESVLTKYKSSFLQNGDVIVADTAEDSTVGKCSEIAGLNDEVVLSGLHTIPYRPVKKFATGYLGYYLNSNMYHNQLIPLMQGIKVTSISKSAMQDTNIVYPKLIEEQTMIGSYFKSLDHLITLHQQKCDDLINLKKYMLQNMFV